MLTAIIPLLLTVGAAQGAPATDEIQITNHPPCEQIDHYDTQGVARRAALQEAARQACRIGPPVTAQEADSVLANSRFGFNVDLEAGEVLVAARPRDGGPGQSYGALGASLDRISEGLYGTRFRLNKLNEAMLSFYLFPHLHDGPQSEMVEPMYWRGPDAPALSIVTPELEGRLEQVTLFSEALGETRRLLIYTPPNHDPETGDYPVILIADGGKVGYYSRLIDAYITDGRLQPLVMIGLVGGRQGIVEETQADVDYRNADYLPDLIDPRDRFERHLAFAADEVLSFAQDRFGVSSDRRKTMVNGRSSGGGFAFHAGMRRPDVFGHALVHSPGATVPGTPPPPGEASARFHIVAGRYETHFLTAARRAQTVLSELGYETSLTELSAGHTMEITQVTLAPTLETLFPGPAARRPTD